jgi:hypothetical protein
MQKPQLCSECDNAVPPEDCLLGEGRQICYDCHLESLQNNMDETIIKESPKMNMKIHELIELLQQCNQEATIKVLLDLPRKSRKILVLPEDEKLRQTITEITLIV